MRIDCVMQCMAQRNPQNLRKIAQELWDLE
jgi:hypothetical protein